MLCVVDIGNTNVTLGLVRGNEIVATRRAATNAASTPDEIELLIDGLLRLDGASLADVSAIACASVVPALTDAITTLAATRELPLLVVTAENVGIPVRVPRPSEVGADRLVNALAAGRLHGTPAVVVDFGTATTFDVVASDGAYVGGAIAPGLALSMNALAARTAKLPRIELRAPERVIGTDTVSAMQAGVVLGYRALTVGLLARIRDELAATEGVEPSAIRTILTGGLSAAEWAHGLPGVDEIDPDLTLRGLAIVWADAKDANHARPGASAATAAPATPVTVTSEGSR